MITFFHKKQPDIRMRTGSRDEWAHTADGFLEGMFRNVKNIRQPLLFPRSEFAISYPQKNSPPRTLQAQRFEALARSFLLAGVRLRDDPQLHFHHISLRDYYAWHILQACRAEGELSVGRYAQLLSGEKNKGSVFQQTVEAGLLTIGLWSSRTCLWERYSPEEQGVIVEFLEGYAYGNTVHQNWRLFNLLMLSFLESVGRPQDRSYMHTLMAETLHDYAGDGWYRDGQHFDYYSCWAYQLFLPLICRWYAAEHEPELTKLVASHSRELMQTYPRFFDAEGRMLMWGRSGIYRCAAATPFIGSFLLPEPTADPGLARKLCTGALKQFVNRPDVLQNGVLTLGFYGPFAAMVQPYSCAESPGWMFLAFLCLLFGADHPFWSAPIPETSSEKLRCTVLNAPGLCVSEHPQNGSVILRTAKVEMPPEKKKDLWGYAKLCYHSRYPWESTLENGCEAMQYSLRSGENGRVGIVNRLLWHGERNGILYRMAMIDARANKEWHWTDRILLADKAVDRGILRFDVPILTDGDQTLTLGSFGFPFEPEEIQSFEQNGYRAMVLSGTENETKRYMAMTVSDCFSAPEIVHSRDTSACAKESWTITAAVHVSRGERALPSLLISQVLTGEQPFSMEELFPIRTVTEDTTGYFWTAECRNGDRLSISFDKLTFTL